MANPIHAFSGLRFRLLLVALLAVLPSFVLTLLTSNLLNKRAEEESEQDVAKLAQVISLEEEQLIKGTLQLLTSLGQIPQVAEADTDFSGPFFSGLLKHFQRYANFGVIRPNGELAASAVPLAGPLDLSDRNYFRRALQTREFSIGDFQIGRLTGKPSINFGYPVLGEAGQVKAVIFAAVDLFWLSEHEHAAASLLSPGSIFAKIDANGTLIAYQPDSSEWLGKPAPWNFVGSGKARAHGIVRTSAPDGIPRVYAFETVRGSKLFAGELTVVIGIPRDILLAEPRRLLVRNFISLAVVALLVLTFAWVSGSILILSPTRAILRATEELSNGNLSARTGLAPKKGEIGHLGLSIDRMAETLQKHDQERVRMNELLQESEEKYRTLVETSPDGIVLLDEDLKIIMANRASLRLAGKQNPEQLVGRSMYDFVATEDRSRLINDIKRFFQDKAMQDVEYSLVREDGTSVPIEVRASLPGYPGTASRVIICVLRDISGRKQAEEEKKKMQAQLFQAQKMDSIGTLAGGVAHDFNNLLTVIVGHADFAMSATEQGQRAYLSLKEIHRAAMRAADLTHQLLLFSRKQPMDLIPLNLNDTVEGLLKMLGRLIGEDVRIETRLAPELWTVRADAGNMEQTLMNLALNARDAMPAGGTLTIATSNELVGQEYCALYPYARPGRFVCLSIADTGAGMTPEVMAQAFEPFFTTKGMGKGTGLGLSVVYGIVKQHEAWINVRSEPGKGSAFHIFLPAFGGQARKDVEQEAVLSGLRGHGEQVLVVEDDEAIRDFMENVLREYNYLVTSAATAKAAMESFEKHQGAFALVLSDVVLPDQSGVRLVETLVSSKPELKVLLSSGYADDKSQWTAIRDKGLRFMQKPYTLTGLLRAVRASLEASP